MEEQKPDFFQEHRLNAKQALLLIVLVSFVVSLFSSITAALFVFRILRKGEGGVAVNNAPVVQEKITKEINEKISRQDELVVYVVKKASPGVVSIVATRDVPVYEQYFFNPFEDDPFFQQFFEPFQIPQRRQKGEQKQRVSAGTGFIVSSDGYILTNKHVVADTKAEYTVFFNDGTKVTAQVLARDPFQDLAVLKINKSELSPLALGNSSALDIGQTVIAIGNSLGEFGNTVSVGIVSGLGRSIVAGGFGVEAEELQGLIQTDAAINPGNSGGPLLNLRGEVIGINTAMAQGAENIGFAIPINKAKKDIESVKKTGKIIYPFIGIRYVLINKAVVEEKKLSVDYGALIIGDQNDPAVVRGSPADKAGLKENDIILEIGGEKITQENSISDIIQRYSVGDSIALKILRERKEMVVLLVLAERE